MPMTRGPDKPCDNCGKLCWRSRWPQPDGTVRIATLDEQHICYDCRRAATRRTCANCGTEFQARLASIAKNKTGTFYCSRACHMGAVKLNGLDRHLAEGTPKRRAEYWGVEYEPVNREKVFRRDKWRCGICGKKVDKRLRYPSVLRASLDHVVPMSRGGGHTYANTQCSHLTCNVTKQHFGSGEQLALC